jgi:hypothetical protein
MKRINYIVGAVTVLLIVLLSVMQTPQKKGPPPYNAAAETTVSGVVEETREFFCGVSDEQGLHLVLRTNQGKVMVHVAPARFLRSQQITINPNDQVSVVGTRVNYQGQESMLAREITRGNEVLVLRDHEGRPLWLR